ncbi:MULTISPECIES: LuxR C-terminal-related transcriptional regulator [Microbacterium]|uniref:helix-turn-helix transcriptional regulator n=1 Tax=Microbacterium TaxID=33882 RepID=UPI00277F3A92|nr:MULTISPECIES: LuxR C-terminal-related transcriptional regulator [Microbacterium]MDQ1084232.1 DNA-binding CsgD family transcriptional regulator [Microbacterium sp. SORGH_AS_0344]MDQ1170492.1 DNA-binding CsgD family transcriptional regulator [Microbacterium proteolyticum]
MLSDELSLIGRYFVDGRLTGSAELTAAARSRLMAAAGEYCSAIGWPELGAHFGADALLFADDDALRYRAHAVSGLAHAINGEYVSAETHLGQAHALFSRSRWPEEETDYLTLLTRTLLAPARMDPGDLADVASTLERAQPDNRYWAYTARAARVMQGLLEGDYSAAFAAGNALCEGLERRRSHRMVRGFVLCIRADILVACGEHEAALASLAGARTHPGHAICFHMQRSAALLHLGRERELLTETEACVSAEPEHCMRTLVPVKLRRALAHARLRDPHRAEQSMTVVLTMIANTGGSVAPFIMLPRDEVRALLGTIAASHPHLIDTIGRILRLTGGITTTPPAFDRLTPAQQAIAALLAEGHSSAEIARRKNISVNTLKTHIRLIYRKLGVSNRAEAVAILLAGGV